MLRWIVLTLVLVVGAVGMQACGSNAKPEESCNFVQNSEAQRVSWSSAVPVYLHIDASVPSEFKDAIRRAAATWNEANHRELLKIAEDVNSPRPTPDRQSVIYWMTTWEADRSYEQARTTVYWAGDQISEADVRINAKNFHYVDGKQTGLIDIESLLIHEFGHVLGLAHNEEQGSVMAKSLASNTERRDISEKDQGSLRCEY